MKKNILHSSEEHFGDLTVGGVIKENDTLIIVSEVKKPKPQKNPQIELVLKKLSMDASLC